MSLVIVDAGVSLKWVLDDDFDLNNSMEHLNQ